MAIWGVECGLVKTTANGKMISKVLASNGKESKLYNSILEHVTDMKSSDLEQLRDAFRDWEGDVVGDVDNSKHLALALYSLTHSEKFKNWFQGSKAVDENGEPMLMYHGGAPGIKDFKESEQGKNFSPESGTGFFFTPEPSIAKNYAETVKLGEVYPTFLSMRHPTTEKIQFATAKQVSNLRSKGYDSAIFNPTDVFTPRDAKEKESFSKQTEYVVFEPNQIKSLFNTVGETEYDSHTNKLDSKYGYQIADQGSQLNYDDYGHIEDLDARKKAIEERAEYLQSKGAVVETTENGVKHWADGNNIYFQSEDSEGSKMLDITVDKWKDWFEAKGIDYKAITEGLTDEQGNFINANESVDVVNKVIRVVAGKENVAIGEAGMHIVTRIIKEQNPKLFKEMMNKVDNYELYSDTFMKYRELRQYQTPEGKPDVAKIKEEVIGKLLNEYYIDRQEGSTEKPERIDMVYKWWQKITDYLSDFFKGNPFHTRAEERRNETEKLFKEAVEGFEKGTYEMDVNRLSDISEGETHGEFRDRTLKTVRDIAAKVPNRTAIVTHGTAIALLKEWKKQGYTDENVTESGQDTHMIDNGHVETLKVDGKTLFFVRHGESKSNGMDLPSNTQTPLTEKGKQDAVDVAEKLKALGVSGIIATDTERTVHTADIVRSELALPGSSRLAGQVKKLYGIDTKDKETMSFHIDTLNKVSSFLEAAGIPEEFVDVIRNGNGTPVENALAAANFMTGTIQYIEDMERRNKAWDKKPEEAAHFFFRLMRNDNPLKEALWKAANNHFLGEEYEGLYKDTLANKEEFIGQKIAEAIKALEEGFVPKTPIEKNFLDKFMDFIGGIINHIKSYFGKASEATIADEKADPFGVAAIKILEGDSSDMMSWEEYKALHDRAYPDSAITTESIDDENINRSIADTEKDFQDLLDNKFKKRTKYLNKTLDRYYMVHTEQDLSESKIQDRIEEGKQMLRVEPLTLKLSEKELSVLRNTDNYTNITPTLKAIPKLLEKYRKNPISLSGKIVLDGVKKEELAVYNAVLGLIKDENPGMKSISASDFANEVNNYLKMNYMLGFAEENKPEYIEYRVDSTFSKQRDENGKNKVKHRKITLRFNDSFMNKKSPDFDPRPHFGPFYPMAFGSLTPFYSSGGNVKDAVLLHELQTDHLQMLWKMENARSLSAQEMYESYLDKMDGDYEKKLRALTGNAHDESTVTTMLDMMMTDAVTHSILNNDSPQTIKERLSEIKELDRHISYESVQGRLSEMYTVKRRWTDAMRRGGIEAILSEDLKSRMNQFAATAKDPMADGRVRDSTELVKNFSESFGYEINQQIRSFFKEQYGSDDEASILDALFENTQFNLPLNRRRTDVNLSMKSAFKVMEKKLAKLLDGRITSIKKELPRSFGVSKRIKLIDKISRMSDSQIMKIKENVDYNRDLLKAQVEKRAQAVLKEKLKAQYGSEEDYEKSISEIRSKEKSAITEYYQGNKEDLAKNIQKNAEDVKKNLKYFTPLIDHLVRTHLKDYGLDTPLYFSGYEITELTQGNESTSRIYAGPEEVAAGMAKEIGPLYKALADYAKQNGIGIKYTEVPGLKKPGLVDYYNFRFNNDSYSYDTTTNERLKNGQPVDFEEYINAHKEAQKLHQDEPTKGYQLDLSNYTGMQRDAPILFGMDNKVKEPSAGETIHSKMKAEEKNLRLERDTENKDKSWYMRTDPNLGKEARVGKRPHDYVEQVYQDAYGKRAEEVMDTVYAETGTRLHKYMDDILSRMVDPSTGMLRDRILEKKTGILPGEEKIYAKLEKYLIASMGKFPKMTGDKYRFVHEQMIYKPAKKAGEDMAGTLDFLAIAPDGSVYHRDWKFMKEQSENVMTRDIDNVKQKAHRVQLNWYANMLRTSYGVKEIRESNTIPFKLIFGKGNEANKLMDVSIGDPDYTNINDASMLPVTSGDIDFEGDPRMSALTKNLMKVLDKLYNEDVPYEDRLIHQQEIQELSYAIRTLVNRKSVDALITSAMNRVKSYIKDIKEVQDVIDKQVKDGKFDRQTVGDLVARISDAKISLETFKDMRNNLAEFIKDMDPDEKEAVNKQLDKINVNITEAVNMMYDKNTGLGILEKAGIKIGEDIGIFNIMSPDRELAWDQQMWNTHSSIPIKTGAAYSKIRSTVEHRINMRTSELAYELGDIQKSIEEWMGGTWDDKQLIEAICKKDKDGNWTPYLVNKISKDFYDNLKSAMETSNSKWILKNIDTVAYKEAYATQLERVKKRADEKIFDAGSYREDPSKRKGTLDQERREKYVQWFIDTFDISRPTAFTYKNSWLKNYASKENWSEEYKNIQSVEPLKKLYSYVTELNKRAHKSGMLGDYYIHFLPQMRKRTMDAALHFNGADMKRSLISNFVVEEGDKRYRDEFTGEPVNKLRGKYIYDLKDEKKGYSGVDTDLMKALTLYTKEVIAHEEKSNEEGVIKALLAMEKNKRVLATHQGQVLERQGRPVTKESTVNYEWLEKEIIGSFYDDKYQGDDPGITVMVDGKPMHLSAKKSIDAFVQGFTLKSLGLNPMSAISNIFGGAVNAFINSGKYFTSGELMEAYRRIPECKFYTEEGKKLVSLLNHFVPFTEDIAQHLGKNASKNQVVEWLSGDGLMVLMRKSDNIVQMANALAYFENTMIENGKLVNIREYVKRKNGYYEMFESKNSSKYSQEDRAEMRKKIEAEVKELQNSRNLINDANIKYAEDTFGIDWSVPKLDPSELQLRQQIQQLTRDCLGNRTPDEFAHINSFLIGSAAMNFRNWIPRLAQKRYGRFKYNAGHGTYEQGRMHSVMQAVNDHAQSKLKNIVDVLGYANLGSNENTIIGAAQRQYQRRVAEARFQEQTTESMFERTVSEGEFVENFVRDVKAQVRELQFTVALMASFFAALAFAKSVNKDDDNFAQRGAIKWGMRMLDKFSDELGFFYSPMSTKTIIGSGSILPSFSVFTDLSRFLINIGKEGYFLSTGDEDSEEKNHVLKYAINYVPVVNQVSAYSAMIWEDYAKAMGKSTMGYEWGGFQR